jgi:hypothetical protein
MMGIKDVAVSPVCPIPNPDEVDFVVYHRNCADGFGAAMAAWLVVGNRAKYLPATHGDHPPDVSGKHVVICDFAYSRRVTHGMLRRAASLVVLDHHDTARDDLHGVPNCLIDSSKSGAVLAFQFFHGTRTPVPRLLLHVEDRDIWAWKLQHTRELMLFIDQQPKTFEAWLPYCDPKDPEGVECMIAAAIEQGKPLLAYINHQVRRQTDCAALRTIGNQSVMVVNTNQWISETGNAVAEKYRHKADMALVWYYDHAKCVCKCSLRSVKDDVHVGRFAKTFGGGGHAQSAGFVWRRPIEELVGGGDPRKQQQHHHSSSSSSSSSSPSSSSMSTSFYNNNNTTTRSSSKQHHHRHAFGAPPLHHRLNNHHNHHNHHARPTSFMGTTNRFSPTTVAAASSPTTTDMCK